ncbi:MAG: formylglycine-generating enzyme family protein [Candidatus Hydrogenedens sp.]|nr:formylglycine-generating enzyme family protein [Candidatus Hydrogenedens sp.]
MLPGDVPLELSLIPADTFQMGSSAFEQGRTPAEGPVRTVTLTKDFYMGVVEVTQAQWLAVMGSWPGPPPAASEGLGGNYPAYNVSWNDAKNFVAALNGHIAATDQGPATVRLPSEAEWEHACRAGTQTRFFFGDSLGCSDAATDCAAGTLPGNRTDYMWFGANNSPDTTKPAGSLLPNHFGLYDMAGNVWEWCEDDWHDDYTAAPLDGRAWLGSPRGAQRVFRGGAWFNSARVCRSASRSPETPDHRIYSIGFRVVRTL